MEWSPPSREKAVQSKSSGYEGLQGRMTWRMHPLLYNNQPLGAKLLEKPGRVEHTIQEGDPVENPKRGASEGALGQRSERYFEKGQIFEAGEVTTFRRVGRRRHADERRVAVGQRNKKVPLRASSNRKAGSCA